MSVPQLSLQQLEDAIKDYKIIIDCRPTDEFVNGYLQGAINVVLNENFDARARYFTETHEEVIIVARPADEEKLNNLISEKLKKKVIGIQYETLAQWQDANLPMDMIINVDAYELNLDIKHDNRAVVLDVRTEIQYNEEHIVGAVNMPMNDFRDSAKIELLDENSNLYLHCNGGTRSVLLSSVLKRNGFHNIRNIEGGFKAVINHGKIATNSNNKKTQN